MKMTMSADRKSVSRQSAYTLPEVMMGILIMSIMFVTLYTGFTQGFGVVQASRENLRATQILLDKMETIRLYDWDQLNNNFIPPGFIANYDVTMASTNAGVLYYGTVSIDPADTGTSYSDDLKLVTVRLNWKTGQIARSRDLSTYVCRTGIQNYLY